MNQLNYDVESCENRQVLAAGSIEFCEDRRVLAQTKQGSLTPKQ